MGSFAPMQEARLTLTNDDQRETVLGVLERAADVSSDELAGMHSEDRLIAEVEQFAAEASITQLEHGDVLDVPACLVDHLYLLLADHVTQGAEAAVEPEDRTSYVEHAAAILPLLVPLAAAEQFDVYA
jgi:hypothetical protein